MPPARSTPSVAYSPAILHAAYIEAGGNGRAAARLLGIPRSTFYHQLEGRHGMMETKTAERVGQHVANNLDRSQRQQLVGTANVIRDAARGSPQRMGAERVALELRTPEERRQIIRDRQRLRTASDAQYERFLSSQQAKQKDTPGRVAVRDTGSPGLFSDLAERG